MGTNYDFGFLLQGFAEVQELFKKEGICLAVTEKLPKDSGVAASQIYDNIVKNLKMTNVRGKTNYVQLE